MSTESAPLWVMDNQPSKKWPLYTRGNVGEVFPEVVLAFTWDLYGQAAEDGWRDAYVRFGLVADDDFPDNESMIILGVFGGYCYINASYVRMVGVRAPGGTVEAIDSQFFGESDAPAYVERDGDKNLKASLRLGRRVFELLSTKELPALEEDKARVAVWSAGFPAPDSSDQKLLAAIVAFEPLFRELFSRHIEGTFSVAVISGLLQDLCLKVDKGHLLVSLLGGIGDVESAAPSNAMWALARSAAKEPTIDAAFNVGVFGLVDRLAGEASAASWLTEFQNFIDEFGSRGPNEWDLGSDPWELRPELALAAIDRMRAADPAHDPVVQASRLAKERQAAIDEVRGALNPIDRKLFDKALRATTLLSQGRERSKTTIIRSIHTVRKAHRVLAARAAARGGPANASDTAMLTIDEFRQFMADPPSKRALIEERIERHAELSGRIPPFVFAGDVPELSTWQSRDRTVEATVVGAQIRGIPGCPGVARGRARVVIDPADPGDLGPGDVLIAPITDPSWTPLFLAAEAVVVDVGAVMSHAVIVSRELGIPCVVSAVDATLSIPDGAMIEVDGNNGTVTVLEAPPSAASANEESAPEATT